MCIACVCVVVCMYAPVPQPRRWVWTTRSTKTLNASVCVYVPVLLYCWHDEPLIKPSLLKEHTHAFMHLTFLFADAVSNNPLPHDFLFAFLALSLLTSSSLSFFFPHLFGCSRITRLFFPRHTVESIELHCVRKASGSYLAARCLFFFFLLLLLGNTSGLPAVIQPTRTPELVYCVTRTATTTT